MGQAEPSLAKPNATDSKGRCGGQPEQAWVDRGPDAGLPELVCPLILASTIAFSRFVRVPEYQFLVAAFPIRGDPPTGL